MSDMKVRYQIVSNEIISIDKFKDKLFDDFLDFASSFQEFTKERLNEVFEITYFSKLNDNEIIIGLQFSDDDELFDEKIAQLLIEQFNDFLTLNENIKVSFKYLDGVILKKLKLFYEEIFNTEMFLREFYTYLLLKHFKLSKSNLLEYTNISCEYDFKSKNKIEILKNRLENDLFYIDYDKGYQRFKTFRKHSFFHD